MSNERKVVLYIATSLDGYIAREDDSLDWLFKTEGDGDNGYSVFYESIDTILIGRKTYEQILVLEKGNFPYKGKECYVFTHSFNDHNERVTFVSEDVVRFVNKLKKEDGKDIWVVGGGNLLHTFLKENLVDEFFIQITPTLIGNGIPLFVESDLNVDLELKDVTRFNQFVQLHYTRKN